MSRTIDAANPRKKFTGKERDTESGNDYFLARYYSSNMGGRFLTLDWSKNPQGVPYANYTNPQTLNLYAYVGDNPLSLADADGHCTDTTNAPCELAQAAKKNSDAETSKAQQQSAQSQAAQIPGAVKTAIMNSVNASNAPSGADTTGGFHEEGGIAGTNSSGGLVISPALPGPASHSGVVTESLTPADPTLAGSITDLTVSWHVHPSGRNASGGLAWVQPPSAQDQSVAAAEHQALPGLIHIVVGAGNRTVYFYSGNGYQQMSLKKFMGTQ